MENIRIIYKNLPNTVKAFTVKKDGFYTICLNQNLNIEQNQKSFLHEMNHINNNDFEKDDSVNQIENNAHSIIRKDDYYDNKKML